MGYQAILEHFLLRFPAKIVVSMPILIGALVPRCFDLAVPEVPCNSTNLEHEYMPPPHE
jgi:hypothetical protein